jgi:hypothetical protein
VFADNYIKTMRASKTQRALLARFVGVQPERRIEMNALGRNLQPSAANELERVIEPLASCICATEQPKTALKSAVAMLLREVALTQRLAATQCRAATAA